jgi:quinohemoprotein ethanol dehydrogenase
MRNQSPVRSTQFSFPFSFPMSKCAIALLCCAFSIEPLIAQELDWANYGNDQGNMRYQNIDQINPTNVSQLKPAWTFHTGVLPSAQPGLTIEMTPLVVGGVMYVTSGIDDVFALNPSTGAQIWHYNPAADMPALSTLPICCGRDNRGAAYGNGMIFDARLDDVLVALNAKTGKGVWQTRVDLPTNGATMTLAPQYVVASGGVAEVLVGVSGGEYGVRGHLDAYAAATGKLLWRFWTTVPATYAGATGLHGGAPIWGTPTFDPTLNMVYFSTGNASAGDGPPTAGYPGVETAYNASYGGPRAGTNLYSASIVALDATTGELQWYFQEAHHDIWDYDGPQPTLLFSWNGIPALEHTNKTGYTWILDRASGESLFPYQEVAVPSTPANAAFQHPWPTQPVSSIESITEHAVEPGSLPAGQAAIPMWTTIGPTPLALTPYNSGGMEWPPAAYSPRTHMLYSHARYAPATRAVTSTGARLNGQTLLGVGHGVYGATNTLTGKVAWTIPVVTTAPDSGVSIAGDLVFMGDNTGLFYAANAATGEILWVFDAFTVPGAGGASGSAAVYEINGVEYVVYGFGNSAYNPSADAVIAFALPSAVAAGKKAAAPEQAGALAERARVR